MYKLTLNEEAKKAHVACYFNAVRSALKAIADGNAVHFMRPKETFDLPCHNASVRGLFKILLNYATSESDNFLIAQPDRLWKLIQDYNQYIASCSWRIDSYPYSLCYKFIKKLFSYDRFAKSICPRGLKFDQDKFEIQTVKMAKVAGANWNGKDWSAVRFIESLDVRYCPYCNAETIYAINIKSDKVIKHARSALDHYFPISEYPFLGISLCNLVPSCTRCNTNIKRDRDLDYIRHLNPYAESLHDAIRFECAPIDCAAGFRPELIRNEDDFHFVIREKGVIGNAEREHRGKNLAEFFCLKDTYNSLFRYEAVQDIYHSRIAGSAYYDMLRKMLKENSSDTRLRELFLNVIEDESRINMVRLSKLAIDMHEMVLKSLDSREV